MAEPADQEKAGYDQGKEQKKEAEGIKEHGPYLRNA